MLRTAIVAPRPGEPGAHSTRQSKEQWICELARAAANVAADEFVDASDGRTGHCRWVAEIARIAGRVAVEDGEPER